VSGGKPDPATIDLHAKWSRRQGAKARPRHWPKAGLRPSFAAPFPEITLPFLQRGAAVSRKRQFGQQPPSSAAACVAPLYL